MKGATIARSVTPVLGRFIAYLALCACIVLMYFMTPFAVYFWVQDRGVGTLLGWIEVLQGGKSDFLSGDWNMQHIMAGVLLDHFDFLNKMAALVAALVVLLIEVAGVQAAMISLWLIAPAQRDGGSAWCK